MLIRVTICTNILPDFVFKMLKINKQLFSTSIKIDTAISKYSFCVVSNILEQDLYHGLLSKHLTYTGAIQHVL